MLTHPILQSVPCLALLAITGLSTPATPSEGLLGEREMRFAPAPGTSRALSIRMEQNGDGGELEVVMNGQQVPPMFLPKLNLEQEDLLEVLVLETFVAGDESGPSSWLRHYQEVTRTNIGEMSVAMGEGGDESTPWDAAGDCTLEGHRYQVESEDGKARIEALGEAPQLDDLGADLSFAFLLPEEPVAAGESWTVSGEALAPLLAPCGELGCEFPEESRKYLSPEIRSREVNGELELTLVGPLAGAEGAVQIRIEGTLERITVTPGDLSEVPVADGTATDTITESFELEGHMNWDLAAASLAELELQAGFTSQTHTVRDEDQSGPSYESTFSFAGEWSLSAQSEASDEQVSE